MLHQRNISRSTIVENNESKFDTVDSQASTLVATSLSMQQGDERETTPTRSDSRQGQSTTSISTSTTSGVVLRKQRTRTASATVDVSAYLNSLATRRNDLLTRQLPYDNPQDALAAFIDYLDASQGHALWPFEEVTARQWRIDSGARLGNFVSHLSRLVHQLIPNASIASRWAQTALQTALSCSNRHLAGRSFQVKKRNV